MDWPEKITEQFACFERNLSYTLRKEIGEQFYDNCLDECCDFLQLGRKRDAIKNPQAIQTIIGKAQREGKTSATLEKIISNKKHGYVSKSEFVKEAIREKLSKFE